MDSTGGNDEECRTSLIVLPSYSENSGSDGVTGKDGVTCKDYCSCAFKQFYFINLKLNETSSKDKEVPYLFPVGDLYSTHYPFFFFFHICHSIEGVKVRMKLFSL